MAAALVVLAPGCDNGDSGGDVSGRPGDTIVVLTPADMSPYSYYDEATKEIKGIEIDIVRAAADRLGMKVQARRCPFEELLPRVKAGEADIAAAVITITDARKEDVDFTLPYEIGGASFLYRAGDPMPTMILAETIRVAAIESMTHDFYLSTHGIDPVRFKTYHEAVSALSEGRVDALFFDHGVVRHTVATSGGRFAVSRQETRERFALAVRKGMHDLKAALDAVISERTPAK